MKIERINKFKYRFPLIICLITTLSLVNVVNVYADSAPPPPTIEIKINNLNKEYYATLFTKNQNESYKYYGIFRNEGIDEVFLNYDDEFCYGHQPQMVDTNNNDYIFIFDYDNNVEEFKIVLYDPNSKDFIESLTQTYDRNASYLYDINNNTFDVIYSKYSVNLFNRGFIDFIISVLITITLEVYIGLFYKIRDKKSLKIICFTNLITQFFLFILSYLNGGLNSEALILIEITICVAEIITYCLLLNIPKSKVVTYTIVSNLVSATVGSAILIFISSFFY